MKNNNKIHSKVEETLNSLDDIKRATPLPFLLTRVMAKMNATKETLWERFGRLISRPHVAIAGLALLVVLNILVITMNHRSVNGVVDEQATFVTSGDFSSANTTINDIVNSEP